MAFGNLRYSPKNSLSERSELWGFRGMLLADLRMPSITGSEAVDKYIYISERPPDNQILIQFVILNLIQ